MTKLPALPIPNEARDVMELRPSDDRAWCRVQRVRDAYENPEVRTIVQACEAAGVVRKTYYQDMQNPYVKRRIVEEQVALHELTLSMLGRNWYSALHSMVSIATDPKNRNAVGAFRALVDERERAAEVLGVEEEVADSTLGDLMQSFAAMPDAKRKATLTRKSGDTTLAMEIEG